MGRFSSGPIDVYAQGPVAADGSFAIQLPGEAEMTPQLFDVDSDPTPLERKGATYRLRQRPIKLLRLLTSYSTPIIQGGVIEHVFHLVFSPDQNAAEIVACLSAHVTA